MRALLDAHHHLGTPLSFPLRPFLSVSPLQIPCAPDVSTLMLRDALVFAVRLKFYFLFSIPQVES